MTDAGQNWIPITGNLEDTALRTIEVVNIEESPTAGKRAVLVGGLGGVYRAIDPIPDPTGGSLKKTIWTEFGTWTDSSGNVQGLPNAPVSDLHYTPLDRANPTHSDILVAATVGRGVWTIEKASRSLRQRSELTLLGTPVIPSGGSHNDL